MQTQNLACLINGHYSICWYTHSLCDEHGSQGYHCGVCGSYLTVVEIDGLKALHEDDGQDRVYRPQSVRIRRLKRLSSQKDQ